jgi:cation/acetate symporter
MGRIEDRPDGHPRQPARRSARRSFLWTGFNRRGLLWQVYGGLSLCILLTLFSPGVSGTVYALLPQKDFDLFPFDTPGVVSVPAAFLLGWLGSARPWKRAARIRRTDRGGVTG